MPELLRIVVVGPESTGKSWLSKQLAAHFQTEWVPEYAREYLEGHEASYQKEDLLKIAKGQLALEDQIAKRAKGLLFCDTNLIVIKIWSDHKYGATDPWILDQLHKRSYDYYLLPDLDLPWEDDPLREHPNLREHFFRQYEGYLLEEKLPYQVVSGIGETRLSNAIRHIQSAF